MTRYKIKAVVSLCAILILVVLGLAVSKVRPNSFLLLFFDSQTAYLDEENMCLSVPMERSRQWIRAIDMGSEGSLFCLPAGCTFSRIESLSTGDLVDADSYRVHGKELTILADHSLPSVFVSTDFDREQLVADRNVETTGKLEIYDESGTFLQSASITFKGHGNGSWSNNEKKSWLIKCKEDTSLLGMQAGLGYVAISNAQDGSFLRNHMTFEIARNLGMDETPDDRFVNLYLNNDYQGLYLLATRVEVSGDRLSYLQNGDGDELYASKMEAFSQNDLTYEENSLEKGWKYPDGVISDPTDTGFLFVKVSETDENRYQRVRAGFRVDERARVGVLYPRNASIEHADVLRTYYEQFLESIQKAVDTEDEENPDLSYLQYIDLDSFAKKHLIEQFAKNHDANRSSSYFFIKDLKSDPIIYEGPVWDYDIAYGNYQSGADWMSPGGYIHFHPGLTRLQAFTALQNTYYVTFLKPFLEGRFRTNAEETSRMLSDSAKMDLARWPHNPYRSDDYSDEVNCFLDYVDARKQFFDDTIILGKTFHRVSFVSGERIVGCVYVEDGDSPDSMVRFSRMDYPSYFLLPDFDAGGTNRMQFSGWYEENLEEPVDFSQPIHDDSVFYALWE